MATLEGGDRGFAFASGVAAIASTLLLFRPGDHVVVTEDVYGGTFRLLTGLFERWGLAHTFVDVSDPQKIEAAIIPDTSALFIETPSNPILKITDLAAAAEIAKRRGLLSIIDNTFMTPYLQTPLRHRLRHRASQRHEVPGRPQRPHRGAGGDAGGGTRETAEGDPERFRGDPGAAGLLARAAGDQDPGRPHGRPAEDAPRRSPRGSTRAPAA